jgi:hypothetical protein
LQQQKLVASVKQTQQQFVFWKKKTKATTPFFNTSIADDTLSLTTSF